MTSAPAEAGDEPEQGGCESRPYFFERRARGYLCFFFRTFFGSMFK